MKHMQLGLITNVLIHDTKACNSTLFITEENAFVLQLIFSQLLF